LAMQFFWAIRRQKTLLPFVKRYLMIVK